MDIFSYSFMQNAFIAGTLVALLSGVIGVFVVARGLSFITQTFSEIGFAGAAFSIFMGWGPMAGLFLFTTGSALAVSQLGLKTFQREVAIGVVFSFFMGLGLFFLSISARQANSAMSLLFGSILGISDGQVWILSGLSIGILMVLLAGYRWLLIDTFDPVGAEARGLPVRLISVVFLIVLSAAVAGTLQIVGSLLVFALMITPAATARYLTNKVSLMIACSAGLAVAGVWLALFLSYATNWPVTFLITSVETLFYFAARLWRK
ncbi:MAG TPA: metal ABC transporter permease [Paenibacillus sp.]|uniref:metal ABC transporter permease n=1 Tax=Paenibacillus sp. TaxID=58172 RepID=UPI0028D57908|nr:metal ABC transporter permease [Paenibacillus sp.]HUC93759.1 metal ABC transporter permease [Paenibacillus sp.]